MVIEHEGIVDTVVAANQAVTTVQTEASGEALETAIVEAYANDPIIILICPLLKQHQLRM